MPRPAATARPSALRRVVGDPRVAWAVVGLLTLRLIVLNLVGTARPDGDSFINAGSSWLHNASHLYDGVAAYIAYAHIGPAEGLVGPPLAATLAAPFSLLPHSWGVLVWTLCDCAALFFSLLLIDHALGLHGVNRAWYWAIALIFPPLFAETQASQITGFVMLVSCTAVVIQERRPFLAGACAAVGSGLKLYPTSLLVGVGPRRLTKSIAGFAAAGVVVTIVSFGPIGIGSPFSYMRNVLFPLLSTPYPDCQVVSISTFWDRLVGGVPFPVLEGDNVVSYHMAWGSPELAHVLGILSIAALVLATLLAARRSGWQPLYSMALALSLGGIVPGELRTYQVLPILPIVLIVFFVSLRKHRTGPAMCLGAGMLGLIQQPCRLWFPNIWTVAIVFLVGVCVTQAPHMRSLGGVEDDDLVGAPAS